MRHDNKHLHIAEQDPIPDWLVKSMKAAQTGTIKLDMKDQPAVKIDIINYGNKIVVDFLQPVFFRTTDNETSLFDKLKTNYNLEILCFIASVTILIALPLFAFTNTERPNNSIYRSLSEVKIKAGIFTYDLKTLITSISEDPVGIIST